RLQVEHPVTEMVTGLDLVRLQLLVAGEQPLPPEALTPTTRGHSVEARLYAEDPRQGFLPVTGRLDRFRVLPPQTGAEDAEGVVRGARPRIRVDSGVEDGSVVSVHYDPMLAKVIAWAPTRDEAALLLAGALQRAEIHGVQTNRDLLVRILRHPEFLEGGTDTHFLERHDPAELGGPLPSPEEERLAAVAAALAGQASRREAAPLLPTIPSGWRSNPTQGQHVAFDGDGGVIEVRYRFGRRSGLHLEVNGEPLAARLHACTHEQVGLEVASHVGWFRAHAVGAVLHIDGPSGYSRLVERPRFPSAVLDEEPGSLHAPMPGRIVKLLVAGGDQVAQGQVLVVLEAMKMEHSLRAPHDGTVIVIRAAEGEQVEADQVLVVVE
ncbi:MAG: biotin/lipoyl-containing protein, partial [Acidimicrobiia bacterium]